MDRIRSVPAGPSIEHPPAKPLREAQNIGLIYDHADFAVERFARGSFPFDALRVRMTISILRLIEDLHITFGKRGLTP